jgi:hypothetical protein
VVFSPPGYFYFSRALGVLRWPGPAQREVNKNSDKKTNVDDALRSDALAEREVNKNSDKKTKSDDALKLSRLRRHWPVFASPRVIHDVGMT